LINRIFNDALSYAEVLTRRVRWEYDHLDEDMPWHISGIAQAIAWGTEEGHKTPYSVDLVAELRFEAGSTEQRAGVLTIRDTLNRLHLFTH
jgi:hypothetical protein